MHFVVLGALSDVKGSSALTRLTHALSVSLMHSSLKWKSYAESKCQISISVLVLRYEWAHITSISVTAANASDKCHLPDCINMKTFFIMTMCAEEGRDVRMHFRKTLKRNTRIWHCTSVLLHSQEIFEKNGRHQESDMS